MIMSRIIENKLTSHFTYLFIILSLGPTATDFMKSHKQRCHKKIRLKVLKLSISFVLTSSDYTPVIISLPLEVSLS